jgi:hypothetical protein
MDQVFVAVNKAAALFVVVCIHKGLDWAATWVTPHGWERFLLLLRGTFFGVFALVYLHFLWEILTTFIPLPTRRRDPQQGSLFDEGDSNQVGKESESIG